MSDDISMLDVLFKQKTGYEMRISDWSSYVCSADLTVVGDGILTENGHMSFSPTDKQWLLSETYPDSTTHERILVLFNVLDNRKIDLGSFYADRSEERRVVKEFVSTCRSRW